MEGISLASYSASDDEVNILRILGYIHLIVAASTSILYSAKFWQGKTLAN